jgi:hypothetical protein
MKQFTIKKIKYMEKKRGINFIDGLEKYFYGNENENLKIGINNIIEETSNNISFSLSGIGVGNVGGPSVLSSVFTSFGGKKTRRRRQYRIKRITRAKKRIIIKSRKMTAVMR